MRSFEEGDRQIDAAVARLRAEGHETGDEDVARLSPLQAQEPQPPGPRTPLSAVPASGNIGTAVIGENDHGQGVRALTRFSYSRRALRWAGTAGAPGAPSRSFLTFGGKGAGTTTTLWLWRPVTAPESQLGHQGTSNQPVAFRAW